ncbi:FtsK/SpoIIIE domain-containing protein [Streptomyces sp. NPDC001941]|uniref:FtsK/SpoIIIE domain-containing protein n=1 Tax=Streptomyces sp. NPDC001941 TaxID=3154659 RepID=UPI003321A4FB
MSRRRRNDDRYGERDRRGDHDEDLYAHVAGAIGVLVVVTAALASFQQWTGLPWPAAVALAVGILLLLGWAAWRIRTAVLRWWRRPDAVTATTAAGTAVGGDSGEAEIPRHPELTAALVRSGAIGRDEFVRLSDVQVESLGVGTRYSFLLPEGHAFAEVQKSVVAIASMFGVTQMHIKLESSRRSEREVRMLVLSDPPFSQEFPAPTRQQVRAYEGVPLGHQVTGVLGGVAGFEKASMMIAGMTQTGKTTLVNGLITCLLIAYGDDIDLYLLDGKFSGLTRFEPVAVRYEASDKASVFESMIDDLIAISDRRYEEQQNAIRNRRPVSRHRQIFFIIDEAADFYAETGEKGSKEIVGRVVEKSRSLVAKSLESQISTIMLTQRPSREAIPVVVREQFQYRVSLYMPSEGGAKVALGDSYFKTVAPIHPALLDPDIKGQAVLFARGTSTLLRGFNFPDDFVWEVTDDILSRREKKIEQAPPVAPLVVAVTHMRQTGVDFMTTPDLAALLGITTNDATDRGKALKSLLGGAPAGRGPGGRGYHLADIEAAARRAGGAT